MKIIKTISELNAFRKNEGVINQHIGFVPTMGALHEGHISLVKRAKKETDLCIVSIFVNPTQFNNQEDFNLYPITIDADIALLEKNNCDVVFIPSVEEIYENDYQTPTVDISFHDDLMEGKFRPGHFNGVVQVVYRLFQLVQPHKAFFGLKDLQQVFVIKSMVDQLNLPIEIIACPTLRNENGLALSSRNKRLNEDQLNYASFIYDSFSKIKTWSKCNSVKEVLANVEELYKNSGLSLEYVAFVDTTQLSIIQDFNRPFYACIVAYMDKVRLIDNMLIET